MQVPFKVNSQGDIQQGRYKDYGTSDGFAIGCWPDGDEASIAELLFADILPDEADPDTHLQHRDVGPYTEVSLKPAQV